MSGAVDGDTWALGELPPDQDEAAFEPEWSLEANVDGIDGERYLNELNSPFATGNPGQRWAGATGLPGAAVRVLPAGSAGEGSLEAPWEQGEGGDEGEEWEPTAGFLAEDLDDNEAEETSSPTLLRGSRGPAVRRLQAALASAGFPLDVDGDFGAGTQAAVRAFQVRVGLPADGIVGQRTWQALSAAPAVAPAAPAVPTGPVLPTAPAPAGSDVAAPSTTPLGTLVLRAPGWSFSYRFRPQDGYRFRPQDLLWTAKVIVYETDGKDTPESAAVLWALLNRYVLFTHTVFRTFSAFIRAYSTTLQPVLLNPGAAARHAHKPEFVRTGGVYPGTTIPRGQLRRHLDIQAAPWSAVMPSARILATRLLTGRLPNPGIGLASEFASTRIYFIQHNKREPTPAEWRQYTIDLARKKKWRWVGDVPDVNQLKNAFFLDLRAAKLPPDAVQVLPPRAEASAGSELETPNWAEDEGTGESAWEDDGELVDYGETEAVPEQDPSAEFYSDGESYSGGSDDLGRGPFRSLEQAPDDGADEAGEPQQGLLPAAETTPPDARPGHFLSQAWQAESESWFGRIMEGALLRAEIAKKVRDPKELTNKVFYLRHPDRRNTKIGKEEVALAREWLTIRDRVVVPLLLSGPQVGPIHGGPAERAGVPAGAVLSPLAVSRRGVRASRWARKKPLAAIVVHTTGGNPVSRSKAGGYKRAAVEYALDYYLEGPAYPHYVIDFNGTIYAICDERYNAAHAGWGHPGAADYFKSGWAAPAWWSKVWAPSGARTPLDLLPAGANGPNDRTIGIELLILPDLSYTDGQYRSLARLVVDIARRHSLRIAQAPSQALLGHEDFTPVPGEFGRANKGGGWDPGAHRDRPYFSWQRLWSEIQQVSPGFGADAESFAEMSREDLAEAWAAFEQEYRELEG